MANSSPKTPTTSRQLLALDVVDVFLKTPAWSKLIDREPAPRYGQLLDQMVPGQAIKVPLTPKPDTGYRPYRFPEKRDNWVVF